MLHWQRHKDGGFDYQPNIKGSTSNLITLLRFHTLRFTREVKERTGYTIGWYWQICWVVLSPLVLLILMGFSLVSYFGDISYSQFVGCSGMNDLTSSFSVKRTFLSMLSAR